MNSSSTILRMLGDTRIDHDAAAVESNLGRIDAMRIEAEHHGDDSMHYVCALAASGNVSAYLDMLDVLTEADFWKGVA